MTRITEVFSDECSEQGTHVCDVHGLQHGKFTFTVANWYVEHKINLGGIEENDTDTR